ncbi:MAG: hypothetical protein H6631_19810 [Anaerolineaceae bacterium]|nr:hypothetical protein [Anaerolineaceae bacterium]MCB9101297.1 hypothetical protein [Anaerolineales bacterium]
MLNLKTMLPFLISLGLLAFIVAVNVNTPPAVQAAPLAGFTPDPGDGGGDGDDGGDVTHAPSTADEGRAPTDYVLVRLDQCDMACSANASTSTYEPLAYRPDDQSITPLLIPIAEANPTFEIIAPVRMVHDGSGFIAVGDLSTQHDTRISVPYPGQWEVFLSGEPRFMTAAAIDVSGTNLAQVTVALSEGPVSMGVVEANTMATQLVKCPIACVIDTPAPTTAAPPALPETGGVPAETVFLTTIIILIGLILTLVGLNVYVAE